MKQVKDKYTHTTVSYTHLDVYKRQHLNRRLIEYTDGVKDRSAAIQQRLEEAGLTRKIGRCV